MQHCYYINHERFQSEDSQKAFEFAVSLCKKDKNGYKLVSIPNKSY